VTYHDEYGHVTGLYEWGIGLKAEYLVLENKLGISGGLRFSRYNTSLSSGENDYFLWMTGQEGLQTDYVRISSIKQYNNFLGIPLEFRIFFSPKEFPVRFYVKCGASFNYRLKTRNDIQFLNKRMNYLEETVNSQLEVPKLRSFYAIIPVSVGLKIGRRKAPRYNVELYVPVIPQTGLSSFTGKCAGVGFRFMVQLPVGTPASIASDDAMN
jgi:hypothetical protein